MMHLISGLLITIFGGILFSCLGINLCATKACREDTFAYLVWWAVMFLFWLGICLRWVF